MPQRRFRVALICSLLLMLSAVTAGAQSPPPQRMMIQATAMGTSTQFGKTFNVNLHIDRFSTAADRKILLDAFTRSGHDGLVDALAKMKSKGRIATPWGVGNDVKSIFELPSIGAGHAQVSQCRMAGSHVIAATSANPHGRTPPPWQNRLGWPSGNEKAIRSRMAFADS